MAGAGAEFSVLRAIQEAPLAGPAAWSRATALDPTTVRRTVRRLEAAGVLRGFTAVPAAAVFDRAFTGHEFRTPDPPVLADVLAVEDVAWAASLMDGVTYVVTYEKGASRREALEALLGPDVGGYAYADEPTRASLGRIDWRLLRELLLEPRAPVSALAERTGLSVKTVRRHRDALVARREVRIDPLLRTPRTPGRLFYHLIVHVDDARHLRATARAVPDSVVVNAFDEPAAAYLFCVASSLEDQARHRRRVEALPHVTRVRPVVTEDYAVAVPRLVAWCDDAIEAWGRATLRSA